VLSDTLDSRVQFEGVTTSRGTCNEEDGVISCDIGALDVAASATVDIDVSLSPGLAKGDVLLNQAMFRLNEPDQASTQGNLQMTTLVSPGDFVVNTVLDAPDADAGDGVCATAEGYWSLQAAVAQANATPGRQTISLADWQFNLLTPLEVWDDVDIVGLDAPATVLVGMGENRLITVPGGAMLTLGDVGLQGGYTEQQGGALYNASGDAMLTRVQVSGSFAQNGGGGLWNGGSLTMVNSVVMGNSATYGAGGIANTGSLILRSVTVSGNRGQSGGIASTGTAALNSVTVVRNEATGSGGGLNGGPANFTLRNTILALTRRR